MKRDIMVAIASAIVTATVGAITGLAVVYYTHGVHIAQIEAKLDALDKDKLVREIEEKLAIPDVVDKTVMDAIKRHLPPGNLKVRQYTVTGAGNKDVPSSPEQIIDDILPNEWELLSAIAVMEGSGFISTNKAPMAGSYSYGVTWSVTNGRYVVKINNWRHHSADDDPNFKPRIRLVVIFGKK